MFVCLPPRVSGLFLSDQKYVLDRYFQLYCPIKWDIKVKYVRPGHRQYVRPVFWAKTVFSFFFFLFLEKKIQSI